MMSKVFRKILFVLGYVLLPLLLPHSMVFMQGIGFSPLFAGPYLSVFLLLELAFSDTLSWFVQVALFIALAILPLLLTGIVLLFFRRDRLFTWGVYAHAGLTLLCCIWKLLTDDDAPTYYVPAVVTQLLMVLLCWRIFRRDHISAEPTIL